MIVTRTPVTAYAYIYFLALLGCPFLVLIWNYPISMALEILGIDISLLVLVWHYCSSPELSFVNGIHLISARLSSGCLNITILYLLPFLLFTQVWFILQSILGVIKGRRYSQEKWIQYVVKFIRREPATLVEQ
jgi:hypothetical protein